MFINCFFSKVCMYNTAQFLSWYKAVLKSGRGPLDNFILGVNIVSRQDQNHFEALPLRGTLQSVCHSILTTAHQAGDWLRAKRKTLPKFDSQCMRKSWDLGPALIDAAIDGFCPLRCFLPKGKPSVGHPVKWVTEREWIHC